LVYPRGFPQDIVECPGRVVVYYTPEWYVGDVDGFYGNESAFYSEMHRVLDVAGAGRPRYLLFPEENTTVGEELFGRFEWDGVIRLSDYQPTLD
jgi:hypothetical protein